jgi:hypothetical protein
MTADLLVRVEKLERTVRRLIAFSLVLLSVSLVFLCGGAIQAPPETVRAREFEIVDDQGNRRGTFGVLASGPFLSLDSPDGKRMATLFVFDEDGTATLQLGLRDGPQAALGILGGTDPTLHMNTPRPRRNIDLAIMRAGVAGLTVNQSPGKAQAVLGLLPDNSSFIGSTDNTGRPIFRAP